MRTNIYIVALHRTLRIYPRRDALPYTGESVHAALARNMEISSPESGLSTGGESVCAKVFGRAASNGRSVSHVMRRICSGGDVGAGGAEGLLGWDFANVSGIAEDDNCQHPHHRHHSRMSRGIIVIPTARESSINTHRPCRCRWHTRFACY